MIAFGPVPSRRLGNSLGVDNIPPKHCTYSCAYCQAGCTPHAETARRPFYSGEDVVRSVARKAIDCWKTGARIDAIAFAPDGEPTLDEELALEIRGVKALGYPVAVFTNGSLLSRSDVRSDLAAADLVSVKVDTADERVWKRLDRPCPRLVFDEVLAGAEKFASGYRGTLVTETMLVDGVNDDAESVTHTAKFLGELAPRIAYLATPTRPPADARVHAPGRDVLVRALSIFQEHVPKVELLTDGESEAIADLLAILAVHPMRLPEVAGFLERAGLENKVVDRLVENGQAKLIRHGQSMFLVGANGEFSDRPGALP